MYFNIKKGSKLKALLLLLLLQFKIVLHLTNVLRSGLRNLSCSKDPLITAISYVVSESDANECLHK